MSIQYHPRLGIILAVPKVLVDGMDTWFPLSSIILPRRLITIRKPRQHGTPAVEIDTRSTKIAGLFTECGNLIQHGGPLCQVLDATGQLINIVDVFGSNMSSCETLVERILVFLKKIAEESRRPNFVILQSGIPTATAARLYALVL